MKTKSRRTLIILTAVFTLVVAVPVTGFLVMTQPGGSGVLGAVKTADGCEYVVEQSCNWNPGEPYTVSFYMRDPHGKWGWCYIDHEASRWRDVKMTYDASEDLIVITERGVRCASLDRKTSTFAIDNGSIRREGVIAPQADDSPRFASR